MTAFLREEVERHSRPATADAGEPAASPAPAPGGGSEEASADPHYAPRVVELGLRRLPRGLGGAGGSNVVFDWPPGDRFDGWAVDGAARRAPGHVLRRRARDPNPPPPPRAQARWRGAGRTRSPRAGRSSATSRATARRARACSSCPTARPTRAPSSTAPCTGGACSARTARPTRAPSPRTCSTARASSRSRPAIRTAAPSRNTPSTARASTRGGAARGTRATSAGAGSRATASTPGPRARSTRGPTSTAAARAAASALRRPRDAAAPRGGRRARARRLAGAYGQHYEGEWEDGEPHGAGVFTSSNSEYVEGDFHRGRYVDPDKEDASPTSGLGSLFGGGSASSKHHLP